jgi:hypothetical protein
MRKGENGRRVFARIGIDLTGACQSSKAYFHISFDFEKLQGRMASARHAKQFIPNKVNERCP